jgi:hypothetical protein
LIAVAAPDEQDFVNTRAWSRFVEMARVFFGADDDEVYAALAGGSASTE